MGKTIEGIVTASRIASERRAAGRPVWDYHVKVRRIDDAPFETNRDLFAAGLKASRWFKGQEPGDELYELWDEIKDAEHVEHFDYVLDEIYNLADYERAWIEVVHESADASE